MESVQKIVNESADSIEIGTPSKGGAIKVYGNFSEPETFKSKIDSAILVREYTNKKMNGVDQN